MSADVNVVSARWSVPEGAVVGTIQPQSYARAIRSMALQGPGRSTLKIYRGYQQIPAMLHCSVFPADVRTYDASQFGAIVIGAGEAALFAWTGGSAGVGVTATATVTSEVR